MENSPKYHNIIFHKVRENNEEYFNEEYFVDIFKDTSLYKTIYKGILNGAISYKSEYVEDGIFSYNLPDNTFASVILGELQCELPENGFSHQELNEQITDYTFSNGIAYINREFDVIAYIYDEDDAEAYLLAQKSFELLYTDDASINDARFIVVKEEENTFCYRVIRWAIDVDEKMSVDANTIEKYPFTTFEDIEGAYGTLNFFDGIEYDRESNYDLYRCHYDALMYGDSLRLEDSYDMTEKQLKRWFSRILG